MFMVQMRVRVGIKIGIRIRIWVQRAVPCMHVRVHGVRVGVDRLCACGCGLGLGGRGSCIWDRGARVLCDVLRLGAFRYFVGISMGT